MGVPLPPAARQQRRHVTLVQCVDDTRQLWYCLVPDAEVTPALDELLVACDGWRDTSVAAERLELLVSDLATKGRADLRVCTRTVALPRGDVVTRVCTLWNG